jgi:hypothetical protein
MTKAGGSLVTVKFDTNLKVTKVESGMGAGDPVPAGVRKRHEQGRTGACERAVTRLASTAASSRLPGRGGPPT